MNPGHGHSARGSFAGASIALLLLSGCSTPAYRSTHMTAGKSNTGGVTYYLPMRHARVSFDRVKADSKVIEAETKAKETLKTAQAAKKAADGVVVAQQEYLKALKAAGFDETSDVYKAGQAELIKAEQDVLAKKKAEQTAAAELLAAEAARKAFEQSLPMCGWVDSIKVTLLDPVPDTAHRYELAMEHSRARTDHFKLGTTTSGLLKTADAELKDQTGEILVSLAKSIAAMTGTPIGTFGVSQSVVPPPVAPPNCDKMNWQPLALAEVIDPTESTAWSTASSNISRAAEVKDSAGAVARSFNYSLALATPINAGAARTTDDGIYYRRERPIQVDVKLDSNPIGAFILLVPNKAETDLLQVTGTRFATNDYKLGFENGMLVSVDTTQPSEVLEVVSVPWKIASETLKVVGELVKLRVDHSTSEAAIAEQQVKLVQQMQALIEAQRALEEARKNPQVPAPAEEPPAETP